MSQHKIYTFLLTANLGAAEAWYTKLFGRGPDNRPMGTLIQWELFDQAGVGISTDEEIAGRGAIFLLSTMLLPNGKGCGTLGSCWVRTSRAIIPRWHRCVIPTVT